MVTGAASHFAEGRTCSSSALARLVIPGRDDLAAGPRGQAGQDADIHADFQEPHRAIRKYGVGPARVEAVDFIIVGAVDGTRAECTSLWRDHQASPIEGRTLDHQPVVNCRPGAA